MKEIKAKRTKAPVCDLDLSVHIMPSDGSIRYRVRCKVFTRVKDSGRKCLMSLQRVF